MCGIAGTVNGDVEEIIAKQNHRGPDGNDFEQEYPDGYGIALGHNRLAILDLSSGGAQPMQTKNYVLVANCEIYNYRDLKCRLSSMHDDENDAKTLLRYIDKFGIDQAIKDINGMFAIAVADKERRVHLIVDRFAQKPLYYYHEPEKHLFAFASSPAALLHLKPKWKISERALHSYWKLGSVMYDSIWEGIKKVNAAEHVIYDANTEQITIQKYWEPEYQENCSGIKDLILDSIKKVKVADVPIFIFLSGGIDSTIVASQFEGGNAIHLESPEKVYAQEAADRFGIKLHTVTPAEVEPISAMKDYVEKCGEPSMAGLIPWITAKEVVKYGKVAISANGADELFLGYNRTQQNITADQVDHIFRSSVAGDLSLDFDIDDRLSAGRWLELLTYIQCDLNKTLDFASMAHSLEVRSPFLDHRLVEMALSIPQAACGRKQILKDMLHGLGFSQEYTGRPKMGFSLYTPIPDLDRLQENAYEWAKKAGFLKMSDYPGKRDFLYLKASAFGFQQWYEFYKDIIQ